MKGTVKKKFIVSYILLILFFVVAQSLFNVFFAEPIFTYQKTVKIKQAFTEIKSAYTQELNDVELVAENFNNMNGINIILWNEDGLIYSNQNFRTDIISSLKNKRSLTIVEEYTDNPEVKVHDLRDKNRPHKNLQLKGKFLHKGDTIYVVLSVPMASIQNNVKLFTQFTVVISLIILLVAIIISVAIAKRMSEPICSIEKIARRISNMDFSCIADENVDIEEISMLARSINHLSERLRITIEDLNEANQRLQCDIDMQNQLDKLRQEFIASVSHEMKTPLGLLQVYTENLKNNIDGIDRDYYCDTILEETERLNRMIVQMLEFSSIDTGFTTMNFEHFNLSILLMSIIRQYRPMLEPYVISESIEENVIMNGDKEYLSQVIRNLLNNAIQHTEENNQIRLILKREQFFITLYIYNEGTQIPEEDINHVWDAFYRVDKARTRTDNSNIGFGLYIVKTVVEKHLGFCDVKNENEGVSFTISLPLLDNDKKDMYNY